ncbi:MAG: serine hydrolase, partial [Rhizobiales bacterium]|nr:serine hydrolase [Hyphomicrobiales bacterium]
MPGDDERHRATAAGFVPDIAERLDAGIRSGLLRDLHAVVAARGDTVVLERYWSGEDAAWGEPLGVVRFAPETLHDLRSVTKSIVGLLYGIALGRGLVPPPEAPLMAQFPDYPDLAGDPARAGITVGHALTMTLGTEWNEDLPYTDPANGEIAMEMAPDRYRYVLERPVVEAPGTRWVYSGGAVALVGALLARGTGLPLPDFAREALFAPLGIEDFVWMAGRDGVASAASGLRLRSRDLLAIGQMVAAGGTHGGRQVVPASWIEASFTPRVPTGDGLEYGYLWFLGQGRTPAFAEPKRWAAGFGNGGQRLCIMPEAGLAAVIFAGQYDRFDTAWIAPNRVWNEIVVGN